MIGACKIAFGVILCNGQYKCMNKMCDYKMMQEKVLRCK